MKTARLPVKHGLCSTYNRYRCRCVECTAAQKAYHRAYRTTANGKDKTDACNRRAGRRRVLAAQWMRKNQPDVWASIVARTYVD